MIRVLRLISLSCSDSNQYVREHALLGLAHVWTYDFDVQISLTVMLTDLVIFASMSWKLSEHVIFAWSLQIVPQKPKLKLAMGQEKSLQMALDELGLNIASSKKMGQQRAKRRVANGYLK